MGNNNLHIPVLLNESIAALNIKPDGVYFDCTFGDGGHSEAIMKKLSSRGKLVSLDYSLDKDYYHISNYLKERNNFFFRNVNFTKIKEIKDELNIEHIDGFIFDLGISSRQLFDSKKGLSYRQDEFIDMKINKDSSKTAFQILNDFSEKDIADILYT